VAELVRQVKGASSYAVSHVPGAAAAFRWQTGYGAFSVRRDDVPVVKAYVLGQEVHHRTGRLNDALEQSAPLTR
jgi:hypothetical protein